MVGLSVVLEGQNSHDMELVNTTTTSNMSKAMVIHHTSIQPISPRNNLLASPTPASSTYPSTPGRQLEWFWQVQQPPPVFLDRCFLCRTKLLPGNDIYMYKGDRGFCSVECRCSQISLDEQSEKHNKNKNKTLK